MKHEDNTSDTVEALPSVERVAFFVSRAGADRNYAKHIAGRIKRAGRSVFYQDEDVSHADFMRRMEQGFAHCERVVALLSAAYLRSEHCRKEYNTVLVDDPANLKERLIVLRIEDYSPGDTNLATLAYTDLVPHLSDLESFDRVVAGALGLTTHPADVELAKSLLRPGQQVRSSEIRSVHDFIGREGLLNKLRDKFWDDEKPAPTDKGGTVALYGIGGVGKTELARRYSWNYRNLYQGMWWIHSASEENIVNDLTELGRRTIRNLNLQEPRRAARRTLEWVSQAQSPRPWLLVFDNVDSLPTVRDYIPDANTHVLFTSRLSGWDADADSIEIDTLEADDAVRFLAGKRRLDEKALEEASKLARDLGYLPLALSHARSYCKELNLTFEEYRARIPELIRQAPVDARYPDSVFATFSLSIERARALTPYSTLLMFLCAHFAPDRMPLWLLEGFDEQTGSLDDSLVALARVSLLRHERLDDGERAVSVHPLVQEVTHALIERAGMHAEMAAAAMELLRRSAWDSPSRADAPGGYVIWLPHAESALLHAESAPLHAESASDTTWVNIKAGNLHLVRGELASAGLSFDAALDAAQSLSQLDPGNTSRQRDVAVALYKLGDVRVAQGSLDGALQAYRDSLEIVKRISRSDPGNTDWQRDVAVALDRVGNVRKLQGNLDGAFQAYRDSLEIAERLFQSNPGNTVWQRDVSVSLEKIGDVWDAQGNREGALQVYHESLVIRERLAESNPGNIEWQRDLSLALNNVGDMWVPLGDLEGALRVYWDGLEIREQLAQSDPGNTEWQRDVSMSLVKVGNVHVAQGELDDALQAYRDSLKIAKRLAHLDPENTIWQRDLSLSLGKVGDVRYAQGNLDEALQFYRDSLEIAVRLAQSDPGNTDWQRDLFVSHAKAGSTLAAMEQVADALRAFKEAETVIRGLSRRFPTNSQFERDQRWVTGSIAELEAGDGD